MPGAARRVDRVGGPSSSCFANTTCRSARWSDAKMNEPTHCEPSVPRPLSLISPEPRMWRSPGFTVEFETDHNSGQLHNGAGPNLSIAEIPESE
jgi:hypothetical protein